MIPPSPNGFDHLVQSLTTEQLMQIVEAIATGHSADLQFACEQQLQQMPPPSALNPDLEALQRQIQALKKELVAERTHRQAAEHEAILWHQKLVKAMNYLRRHI
jgi:hypothetical protein